MFFPYVLCHYYIINSKILIQQGTLKTYQLKGMNWLCSLYDQGINGILADEMGLGKTVQSLSFLAYVAETYGVWGPFLVITPASTLHNWQQVTSHSVFSVLIVLAHRRLPDLSLTSSVSPTGAAPRSARC